MQRLWLIMAFGVLAGSALPANAAAAPPPACVGVADVAALDEYCPKLPSADGLGREPGPRLNAVLPARLVAKLKKAGPLGDMLLALSVAAPERTLNRNSRGRGLDAEDLLRRGSLGGGARKPSGNPLSVAASAVTGGQLNAAFGAVLLLSAVGISGGGWRRFRRRRLLF